MMKNPAISFSPLQKDMSWPEIILIFHWQLAAPLSYEDLPFYTTPGTYVLARWDAAQLMNSLTKPIRSSYLLSCILFFNRPNGEVLNAAKLLRRLINYGAAQNLLRKGRRVYSFE